ncbi:COX15/CtaA family protein [Photobacterium ganghwense]|uniref:COX15/CtaA family protein n=1 Tax=Photobacterium ganghwense TaxID=320778 RepID=UPI0039F08CE9
MSKTRKRCCCSWGCLCLPVGIAKLVLDMDWYHGGVTNRGDLLEQPLTSDWLGERHRWQLIYLLPDHCDDYCQGRVVQTCVRFPQAVGADHSRLDSVLLVQGDGLAAQPAAIRAQATGVTARQVPDYIVAKLKAQAHGTRAIYIADPMGKRHDGLSAGQRTNRCAGAGKKTSCAISSDCSSSLKSAKEAAMQRNGFRLLVLAALILSVCVIGLGAYTRLTEAGLGCPDWPGCYGFCRGTEKPMSTRNWLLPAIPMPRWKFTKPGMKCCIAMLPVRWAS